MGLYQCLLGDIFFIGIMFYSSSSSTTDNPTSEVQVNWTTTGSVTTVAPHYPMRIVPMSNSSNLTGHPEIFYNGSWERICDLSQWSYGGATVACQEAGFEGGWFARNSHFGGGGGDYNPGLVCPKSPTSQADCYYDEAKYCDPNRKTAGVFCFTPGHVFIFFYAYVWGSQHTVLGGTAPYRMYGYVGLRVERSGTREWLYVMDEDWEDADALVACREFGYPRGTAYSGSSFWSSWISLSRYITRVNCSGEEEKIADCPYDEVDVWTTKDDIKWSAAGVLCHFEESLPGFEDIRTRAPGSVNNGGYGWVEIKYNSVWGAICDSNWTDADATTVCKSLGVGYNVGYAIQPVLGVRTSFNPRIVPVWMKDVVCDEEDEHILNCSFTGWGGKMECDPYTEAVGVICLTADLGSSSPTFSIKPYGDSVTGVGNYIEVNHGGFLGSLEDAHFTQEDATVVCREADPSNTLGYPLRVEDIRGAWGYTYSRPVIMRNPVCNGTEASLSHCAHEPPMTTGMLTQAVGALCLQEDHQNLTLALWSQEVTPGRGGALTVTMNGVQGMIVGLPRFHTSEAMVACRHLGFNFGLPNLYNEGMKKQGLPFWLWNVTCSGDEESLFDCSYAGIGGLGYLDYVADYHGAGVYCYSHHAAVRLMHGRMTTGTVVVDIDGEVGTIDHSGWDNHYEGRLLCDMFGYASYVNHLSTFYPHQPGFMWATAMRCVEDVHQNLFDCPHNGWKQNVGGYDPATRSSGLSCLDYNYNGEHFIETFATFSSRSYHTSRTAYSQNIDDTFTFHTQENHKLAVYFTDFDVQASADCVADYLLVYDGDSSSAPLLSRLCGNHPGPLEVATIRSTSNSLHMHWVSNGDGTTGRGWLAIVEKECAGRTVWSSNLTTGPVGTDLKRIDTVSLHDCQRKCDADSYCFSAFYDQLNQTCYLRLSAYADVVVTNLTHLTMLHLFKECRLCGSTTWKETTNTSLGGNLIAAIDAYSLEDCQEECRKRGLCRSLDYTNSTKRCMLRYRLDCGNPSLIVQPDTNHYEFICEDYYCQTQSKLCEHWCATPENSTTPICECCPGYDLLDDGSCHRAQRSGYFKKQPFSRVTNPSSVQIPIPKNSPGIGRRMCAQYCSKNYYCSSYNYNPDTQECELSSTSVTSATVSSFYSPGSPWTMYYLDLGTRSNPFLDVCWENLPDYCWTADSVNFL